MHNSCKNVVWSPGMLCTSVFAHPTPPKHLQNTSRLCMFENGRRCFPKVKILSNASMPNHMSLHCSSFRYKIQIFIPLSLLILFIHCLLIQPHASTGERFTGSWRWMMMMMMIYQLSLACQTNVPCLLFF